MTGDEARSLFLPLHGAVGLLALVGGFGALASRKGSVAHRRLGRVFIVAMALAIVAASPVLVATDNLFLTGMGAFAGYMAWTGWRLARQREAAGGALDRAVSVAMIGGGLAFASLGVRVLAAGGANGVTALAMGVGGALFAWRHLAWFRAPRAARRPWIGMHVGAAGGALIAGLTAFGAATLTNWLPAIPEPVIWLGPTVVLGPLLRRMSGRVAGAAATGA